MQNNQFTLLTQKRFLPLFVTQFLGAFHDNLFKNALVALLLFGTLFEVAAEDQKLLVTCAAGILILPFILFSALGGQLADKYPKDKVIRAIKLAEVGIAALGIMALFSGSIMLCFTALFALGTQSAFFGPSKYSILPDHLAREELIGGNALLNTGTFLAILSGTIAGTLCINLEGGRMIAAIGMMSCAIIGYLASRSIPSNVPKAPNLKLDMNPLTETGAIIKNVFAQKPLIICAILGVSWFYFLGAMFMAQFPSYTKETLGGDEGVLTFFLVIFSVGIGIGGLLNNRILQGRIEAVYVPLAILGITFFSVDLYFASTPSGSATGLLSLKDFLAVLAHWRVALDILMIAVCGGLFVVPLNAMIQYYTDDSERARVIAGSAIINAIFIVASAVFAGVLIVGGFRIEEIFLSFSVFNFFVAFYIYRMLPKFV